MTEPTVIVGITTRNRAAVLQMAIASVQAQTYRNLRIVVLDDGSEDETQRLPERYPEIQWLRHSRSIGIIESRNELMQAAKASYFVSLDDDAWFISHDEISLAVARLETNSNVAAVAFDILSPTEPTPTARQSPQRTSAFIGCGHVLRLAAVAAAGYYASVPGAYGSEERDLCYRFADLGYTVERLPGVHVWHDKAWNDRDWYPLHRSGVCNELVMTVRRCPMPDLLAVLPLKLASFTLYWARKPVFFSAGVAGVGLFVRNLRPTWATRAPLRRKTFWLITRGRFT